MKNNEKYNAQNNETGPDIRARCHAAMKKPADEQGRATLANIRD
jgi:hypothetical protein